MFTIICDDALRTISKKDITLNNLLGLCVFGDASKKSYQIVCF